MSLHLFKHTPLSCFYHFLKLLETPKYKIYPYAYFIFSLVVLALIGLFSMDDMYYNFIPVYKSNNASDSKNDLNNNSTLKIDPAKTLTIEIHVFAIIIFVYTCFIIYYTKHFERPGGFFFHHSVLRQRITQAILIFFLILLTTLFVCCALDKDCSLEYFLIISVFLCGAVTLTVLLVVMLENQLNEHRKMLKQMYESNLSNDIHLSKDQIKFLVHLNYYQQHLELIQRDLSLEKYSHVCLKKQSILKHLSLSDFQQMDYFQVSRWICSIRDLENDPRIDELKCEMRERLKFYNLDAKQRDMLDQLVKIDNISMLKNREVQVEDHAV